ncbi:MAG: outer rane efflux protein [Cyanobacteria bacterium RYN_339]|nr:outer rane efflux protein [Cyanobacteria bacterium RYN_339]
MLRHVLTTATILAAVAGPAAAQGTFDTSLDLAEAVLLARDNSLAAQQNRQQLKVTEADRSVAVSSVLPSVSLQTAANYNRLPASQAAAFGGSGGFGGVVGFPTSGTSVDTTISAQQVIFDAFATRDTLAIYDQQLRIGALAVQQAEQEAMANTAVAYFDVLRSEGLAGVSADGVKQAAEHLRLGDLRMKAGTGTRAEVLQLRAQLANAQGNLTQARNAVNIARMNLANLLNAPVGDRPLATAPVVPPLPVDLARDLAPGVDRRPEVQTLLAKTEADQTRVSQESRALWPNLTATSSYSQRDLNEGQFGAGLKVSWALFDSFKVRNRMESALNSARVDQIQAEQARQRVALEIRQQYQTREEAKTRILSAREGLASAQEAYRLAVKRYKVGVATTFEVTDVQNTLIQSGNNYVQALNDMRASEVRLAKALGLDLAEYLAGKHAAKPLKS